MARGTWGFEQGDQIANGVVPFEAMPQGYVPIDLIMGASAETAPAYDPRIIQLTQNALNRSICDAHGGGDVPHAGVGITGDAQEYVRMVAEEGPFARTRFRWVHFYQKHILRFEKINARLFCCVLTFVKKKSFRSMENGPHD